MLINCSKCRKMISNYRNQCPHCCTVLADSKKKSLWWRFAFPKHSSKASKKKAWVKVI